jgi:tripartite-type tricarboxylate transporter receptor subunit TctC
VAPARTPMSIIEQANVAINLAIKDKSVIDSLAGVGLLPYGGSIDDMVKSQQLEFNRWGPLVKRVGFTAES